MSSSKHVAIAAGVLTALFLALVITHEAQSEKPSDTSTTDLVDLVTAKDRQCAGAFELGVAIGASHANPAISPDELAKLRKDVNADVKSALGGRWVKYLP